MIRRILLAVDDSAASMAAAAVAIELAAQLEAEVTAVSVIIDHAVGEYLSGELTRPATVAQRRAEAATALLAHVARLGVQSGVLVRTVLLGGEPAACILGQARSWPADLVVLGHSHRRGAGQPYVGAQTQHVLEFAEQPVLVVPASARPSLRSASGLSWRRGPSQRGGPT